MSVRRRLERLEARRVRAADDPPEERARRRRIFEELHGSIERHRAVQGGEDPGPLPPQDVDPGEERRVLRHVIPKYRASAGWQTDEGREFLDEWEQRTRQKLAERSER